MSEDDATLESIIAPACEMEVLAPPPPMPPGQKVWIEPSRPTSFDEAPETEPCGKRPVAAYMGMRFSCCGQECELPICAEHQQQIEKHPENMFCGECNEPARASITFREP